MELAEALEIVVGRTKNESLRNLVNPDHPFYNPAYIPVLIRMATGEPPPTHPAPGGGMSFASDLANIARVKACPHWEKTSECGCGMNRCRAGKGRAGDNAVSHRDCFECLGIPT